MGGLYIGQFALRDYAFAQFDFGASRGNIDHASADAVDMGERAFEALARKAGRVGIGIGASGVDHPAQRPPAVIVEQEPHEDRAPNEIPQAIDQLLEMLKKVDPLKDNLADNEEIWSTRTHELKCKGEFAPPGAVALWDEGSSRLERDRFNDTG